MTAGRGAWDWLSVSIVVAHGNLGCFQSTADVDIDQSALESEKYYAIVEYLFQSS